MLDFFQTITSGIAAGSSYALMGLAMVLIYKISSVPNFAQGEIALASSYIALMMLEDFGLPMVLAFPGSLLFSVGIGCFIEFAILRRAKTPSILGMMIITIGIEMVILGLVSWKFGADQTTMPFPISPYESIELFGLMVSRLELLTFGVALTLMAGLYLFFRFSKLGLAVKAVQQNRTAAELMGIKTSSILMITWGLSSLTGSFAGLLTAPVIMHPYMMWDPMLKGFAAAVMGGMTSLPGAVAAAYLLGIIENIFGAYVSIEFKSVVAMLIIVLVLSFRPSGLFSKHYIRKV